MIGLLAGPDIPASVTIPVVAVATLIPVGGFMAAGFGARAAGDPHPFRLGAAVATGLAAWAGLVVGLAQLGIPWGEPRSLTSLALLFAFVVPGVASVVGLRRAPRLRAALGNRSGYWRLASFQAFRSLGVVFLILHGQGDLPGLFAHPAGWGDLLIGVTAPFAAWVAWSRYDELKLPGSPWRRAFIGWNLLGIADLWVAISLGFSHLPGKLQVVDSVPNTVVFAELPMLLFPAFMVAFAAGVHYVMLDLLRRPVVALIRPSTTGPRARGGPPTMGADRRADLDRLSRQP